MSQHVFAFDYTAFWNASSDDDGQKSSGSNSVSGLVSTLIPSLVTAVLLLSIFFVLRVRVKRVYMPRAFVGILTEQQKSPLLPDSPFSWIKQFWHIPDTYILNHHSLDAYLMLRFWRTIIFICLVGWPLTWLILMPVYGTAHGGGSQFDKISYSNIESHQDAPRLYAVLVIAWIYFGMVMYIIGRECVYYVQLRETFELLPGISSRMSSKTVLFTNVARYYRNEENIRKAFPSVKHVWIVTDTKQLQQLIQDRNETALRLEEAEVKLSKIAVDKHLREQVHDQEQRVEEAGLIVKQWISGKQRPAHRLKYFVGPKVDTINWTREHLQDILPEVEKQQNEHKEGGEEVKTKSAVFVEFEDVQTAEAAFHGTMKLPNGFKPRTIGTTPREIVWENLNMSNWQNLLRQVLAIAIICAMIIFWGVIIAFIGSLSNIDSWASDVSFLRWINDIPSPILGLITGLLPALLLSMIMSLVPAIMRLLFHLGGAVTLSEVELQTQTWHFVFQFIQVFLVTTLSSGAAATVTKIVQDPSQATVLLAQNLPKASNFYVNYLVLQGLAVAPKQLINGAKLSMYLLLGYVLDNTPRKVYNRYTKMPGIQWGKVYPKFTNLAVIAITYSCISPLILAFATIGFMLLFFAFRYKIFYTVDTLGIDTKGRAFSIAMKQLTTGVYVAQLCLIGLFGTSAYSNSVAAGPLILMIIFLILTAIYHVLLDNALIHLEKSLGRKTSAQASMRDQEDQTAINRHIADAAETVSRALPSAVDNPDKATNFLVRLLRPPNLPEFDDYLETEIPEYTVKSQENAYLDPSISSAAPLLWIVRDELGVSREEKEESGKIVNTSDEGAWWDERGKMRTVCDEGGDVDGATKAPIHKDAVPY